MKRVLSGAILFRWSRYVLGRIIELRAGVSYGEFLQTEVFNPLGMIDTAFGVRRAVCKSNAMQCTHAASYLLERTHSMRSLPLIYIIVLQRNFLFLEYAGAE